MENRKIGIIGLAAVLVLAGLIFWGIQDAQKATAPAGETGNSSEATFAQDQILYFYGEGCSHCKDVAKFLEENKIAEKVKFSKLEVWRNKENAKLLQAKAEICKIPADEIGVPLLFAEGKCYVGGIEVPAYFKQAAGLD